VTAHEVIGCDLCGGGEEFENISSQADGFFDGRDRENSITVAGFDEQGAGCDQPGRDAIRPVIVSLQANGGALAGGAQS